MHLLVSTFWFVVIWSMAGDAITFNFISKHPFGFLLYQYTIIKRRERKATNEMVLHFRYQMGQHALIDHSLGTPTGLHTEAQPPRIRLEH